MMSPPTSRVETPHDVCQTCSSSPALFWNFTSKALPKFWPRSWLVPACSALPSCIIASMQKLDDRAGELLVVGLLPADHRHRHHVLGEVGVDVEHAVHLFERLFVRRVRGVAFLPEELAGAQEQARAHLPAHHVGPLVDEQRQIAVALDPLARSSAR